MATGGADYKKLFQLVDILDGVFDGSQAALDKWTADMKDGPAATPSLRTIGAGAQQACGGADTRLPTQAENDALAGSSGAPGAANVYVTNADPRNTNDRFPTAHAATHNSGGSDPLASDAAAATPSLRTLGAGAQQACAGNDARLVANPIAALAAGKKIAGGVDTANTDANAKKTIATGLTTITGVTAMFHQGGGQAYNHLCSLVSISGGSFTVEFFESAGAGKTGLTSTRVDCSWIAFGS